MIFRDDSTPAQKRLAAIERLTALCPSAMQPLFGPIIEQQVKGMTDGQITALMGDVDRVLEMAKAGEIDGVMAIAKNWGATDEQITTFLPVLPKA